MDQRLIEEITMMARQLYEAGISLDMVTTDNGWHAHLEGDGCFAGNDKELHAYLSGAMAVVHIHRYEEDRDERTRT